MKGVILAGGLGTRLYPLTHVTNKHLLPVYNKPMIFYPIQTLVDAGVTDIMIITSGPHVGHFLGTLKNGKEVGASHLEYAYQEKADGGIGDGVGVGEDVGGGEGVGGGWGETHLEYDYQEKPDGGIADALAIAEDFADGDSIAVILGDNTTDESIKKAVANFKDGAVIFLKKVPDPQRFGVPAFDPKDKKKISRIDEKPEKPASDFAVTGLYIYDNKVFDYIRQCDPNFAGRNQLEITEVNNFYINDKNLRWEELKGFWSDAGTFNSLFTSNDYWAKKAGK